MKFQCSVYMLFFQNYFIIIPVIHLVLVLILLNTVFPRVAEYFMDTILDKFGDVTSIKKHYVLLFCLEKKMYTLIR